MAEEIKTETEEELGEDGKPIQPGGEGGGTSPKIESDNDNGDDAEPVISLRRSAAQHIISRQSKTIEKLRSDKDKDDDDVDTEIEEEDNLTPEALGAVQKEVKKAIDPVVQSLVSKADEDELGDLLGSDEGAKKYEKRIRAYMKSPHYKGVPPSVIYHHLAFGDSEAREAADIDAGQGAGGGRGLKQTPKSTGNIPSIEEQNDMSDEEFDKLHDKALGGEFTEPKE